MPTRDFESFLSARLWEDWHDANERRGTFPEPGHVGEDGAVWLNLGPGGNSVIVQYGNPVEGYGDMRSLRTWARPEGDGWTREKALIDAEAKQALLHLHGRRRNPDWDLDGKLGWECRQCSTEYPCRTLRLTAKPYGGHPDYLMEWRDHG